MLPDGAARSWRTWSRTASWSSGSVNTSESVSKRAAASNSELSSGRHGECVPPRYGTTRVRPRASGLGDGRAQTFTPSEQGQSGVVVVFETGQRVPVRVERVNQVQPLAHGLGDLAT